MLRLTKRPGGRYLGEGRAAFLVWAPLKDEVRIRIASPQERLIPLEKDQFGYHFGKAEGIAPGSLYMVRLSDGEEFPDIASISQSKGVHGPSEVTDEAFSWTDQSWRGLPLEEYVVYELHIGTFSKEGTFEGAIPYLAELKELGVSAIEVMPVAQFPGNRNWGYDGVFPFAAQTSYGGLDGLKTLVNACHDAGLAVILDVVYNHLGPEGNFFKAFGPYFTDRYMTPWGEAINFDGAYSYGVREYFIQNALFWLDNCHIDALRLDAIHAILDASAAEPFLAELSKRVNERAETLGRRIYLIGETFMDDNRVIQKREFGGLGLDALWNDDFHHAVHAYLTNERVGYYEDYGRLKDLKATMKDAFVYQGQYSSYFKRAHGTPSKGFSGKHFVVFSQNHDQAGNRMLGERLVSLAGFEKAKLAAAFVVFSPYVPLFFMGEEYAEKAPFLYFIDHEDPELIEAVRKGRKEEFASFAWQGEPPDPYALETFEASRLNHALKQEGPHKEMLAFYKEILALRRRFSFLSTLDKEAQELVLFEKSQTLFIARGSQPDMGYLIFHFGKERSSLLLPFAKGEYQKALDSAEPKWNGQGSSLPERFCCEGETELSLSPLSVALYVRQAP